MADVGDLVARDSAVYQEFARLYQLARDLRPTGTDRWSGNLYATPGGSWGGYNPSTGDIRLSGPLVLRHLVDPSSTAQERAEAIATVLHEATHAGMAVDAPNEPNAVRTEHSIGAIEGFAELRTMSDFDLYAAQAGYPELKLRKPQYPGAFAAMDSLAEQASGPAKDRDAFIAEGTRGPGVMHFDQLADGVVRNRLAEVVPFHEEHRRAVRAALIGAMLHRGWPVLKHMPAETGVTIAGEIRQKLNSKVDEIRRHYRASPGEVFPVDAPNAQVGRERVLDRAKGGAGPRRQVDGAGRAGSAKTGPGNTGPRNTGPGNTGPGNAVAGKGDPGVGHPSLRFLSGQAGAAGAVRGRPVLGDGARGRGTGGGPGQGRGEPERG
ncbi:pentapeptide repeat-containing protein [Kribbella sp. NBC_00382]|uniref:pentapeptide repeat-containing protein n=1 Tax=Kribbella sp. NBC_00382 TaxID=2975967 RepID=UPI002E1FA89F